MWLIGSAYFQIILDFHMIIMAGMRRFLMSNWPDKLRLLQGWRYGLSWINLRHYFWKMSSKIFNILSPSHTLKSQSKMSKFMAINMEGKSTYISLLQIISFLQFCKGNNSRLTQILHHMWQDMQSNTTICGQSGANSLL